MKWFGELSVQVQAAIIAALVTIIGIFLRDLIFKFILERRISRKNAIEIYRRYSDPLIHSTSSLLWRFREIFFESSRGSFLKEESRTIYEEYKFISTIYRLGVVLAWIRAYQQELLFLNIKTSQRLESFEEAIQYFQSALADGPHVELIRLEAISNLLDITIPEDDDLKRELGIGLEKIIKHKLKAEEKLIANDLSQKGKKELCTELATYLCSELHINELPNNVISETVARISQKISIREAWLYRDWQAGIGDLLLITSDNENRKYDVIGYKDFESMYLQGSDEQKRWIIRLKNTLDNLDVSGADLYDARFEQLKKAFKSIALILNSLSKLKIGNQQISKGTLELVDKILHDN